MNLLRYVVCPEQEGRLCPWPAFGFLDGLRGVAGEPSSLSVPLWPLRAARCSPAGSL